MRDDLVRVQRGETPARKKSGLLLIGVLALVSFLIAFGIWRHYYVGSVPAGPLQTTVRTEPTGAMVALDDHIKPSPATFDDLDPRKYRLRIMLAGYDPIETTIDFSDKRSSTPQVFRMVRSTGALEIDASEPGLAFTIRSEDGEIARAGVTPAKLNDLPTGKYEVSARRGDWELRDMIEVRRGETARKVFAFLNATLNVTSEPSGADILIDGVSRGKAPLRIDLPARSHEVSARLQGWPEEQQTIEAKRQQDNTLRFIFANGSVKITSAPGGASVLANGRELGRSSAGHRRSETRRGPLRFAPHRLQTCGCQRRSRRATAILSGGASRKESQPGTGRSLDQLARDEICSP